jgi:signal transduction histidine kinase
MSSGHRSAPRRSSWWLTQPLTGRRLRIAVALSVVAVLAIGVVDAVTGPEWSMQIFYLVPVAWAATVAGRRVGQALALLAATAGFVADVILPKSSDRGAAAFNVIFMLATLLVVVELLDRLRRRAEVATAAEERGREFLAFAAHQLRTPLAAVGATVDALVLCDKDDPSVEELLVRLGAETARAARLLDSLLRVARLDQHEPLTFRPTDLAPLLHHEAIRAERARPDITWITHLDVHGDAVVDCDPDALGEAISNLLDNAVRHARCEITIDIRDPKELVEIRVYDDGPGLPSGADESAFRRFVTMDGHGGSGLGLPIARGIAEAHEGSLTYESGTFVLRVPKHHGNAPEQRNHCPDHRKVTGVQPGGKR